MAFTLESPLHISLKLDNIDWTATYRRDSTIVAPYGKWSPYHETMVTSNEDEVNIAEKKSKKVAWFVSNCNAKNNRLEYARNLSHYIDVDIYGRCGTKTCKKSPAGECVDMLAQDYKFYLAFENSNCGDYITEKFWLTALQHTVLPVVMGARVEQYTAVAPPHSFIHVDSFSGPQDLAQYLIKLDSDDALYNEYFRWRTMGEFIDTKFFCRVCAMLHYNLIMQHDHDQQLGKVNDLHEWWKYDGVCKN